jgi:lysophospholipase L1-like esterase
MKSMRIITVFIFLLMTFLFSSFQSQKEIKYLPLGDSYTICTGAPEKESWPVLLSSHLNADKINVKLLQNPARNGFSTQNLIDYELPLVKKLKPDFVTLLIGVNDWVREVPEATFHKNLVYIMDEVKKEMNTDGKILVITIPDFGVTPQGKLYSAGRDISKGISHFNDLIKEEAGKRGLPVVDIFELSKKMGSDNTLVAADGLHPSAKEYAEWEKLIFAGAKKLLGAGK